MSHDNGTQAEQHQQRNGTCNILDMIKIHNIEHMTYDGVAAVAASRHIPQSLTTAVGIVIMADNDDGDTSSTERSPASSSRMLPKRGRGAGPSKGQSKGCG